MQAMADSRSHIRSKKRRVLLTAAAGLAGALGVFLYGLFVGQQMESVPGIEGVGRLWWFSVVPVVLGIVLATVVTARRAIGHHTPDSGPPDDFERRRAATLDRLSLLVGSAAAEDRPIHSAAQGARGEPVSADAPTAELNGSSRDARELDLSARH